MQVEKKNLKCYICKSEAVVKCADPKCDNLVCKDHTYKIRHALKCQDCWVKDRKIGLIKKYSLIAGMLIFLIILLAIK